jgi:hypothetical protein
MLKKYHICVTAKEDEANKNCCDGGAGGFSVVENVFLIFRGATVDMSNSQRKRERHEVLAVEKAPPYFLDWSADAITFSREDHPNRIPNPGHYSLVIDPVIGNARFSKVLMDDDNNLNILYAHTLRLMGIGLDQQRPSTMPFHGVAPGKHVQPLRHTRQFLGRVLRHPWASVLHHVHGGPELHLPQDEDVGAKGRHHCELVDRARIRLRRRVRGAR